MESASLIKQIYNSIGDNESLAETVTGIARFARSRVAQYGIVDRTGTWVRSDVVGASPEILSEYLERFAAGDPRLPYFSRHPGQWIPCQRAISDPSAYDRSAFVNEFLDRHDARYALPAFIPLGPRHSAVFSFMRSRRDGQYGEEEVRRLTPLLPHLKRAMRLNFQLGLLESKVSALESLVDRIAAPVMFIDRKGALLFANSTGQEILSQARFLVARNGRVEPRNVKQAAEYDEVLGAALWQGTKIADRGTSMRLRSCDGSTALLFAEALHGQADFVGTPHADLALLLNCPVDGPPIAIPRLQRVLGLTPAEARMAERLVSGKSLEQISGELNLSRETLKSQLRSLFMKTGTHRQGQLIAFLLSILPISVS